MTQKYIWQHGDSKQHWGQRMTYDAQDLITSLGLCRFLQGKLLAHLQDLGFEDRQKAYADVLTKEAIKTSEIEGEKLDPVAVRSSVARRLGLPDGGLRPTRNRHAEGVWRRWSQQEADEEFYLKAVSAGLPFSGNFDFSKIDDEIRSVPAAEVDPEWETDFDFVTQCKLGTLIMRHDLSPCFSMLGLIARESEEQAYLEADRQRPAVRKNSITQAMKSDFNRLSCEFEDRQRQAFLDFFGNNEEPDVDLPLACDEDENYSDESLFAGPAPR